MIKRMSKPTRMLLPLFIAACLILTFIPALIAHASPAHQVVEGGTQLTNDIKVPGHAPGYIPTDLNVGKTIEDTLVENEFIITLEVQTEEALTTIFKPRDVALVVIIDNSGTMWQDIYGPPYDSPAKTPGGNNALDHAKQAAEYFVRTFAVAGVPASMLDGQAASAHGFVRDIGVIEFSLGAEACWPLTDALADKGEGASQAIDDIYGKGGTNLAAAIRLARNMLLAKAYGPDVDLHVVILTDGAPNRDFKVSGVTGAADSGLYSSLAKLIQAPHETAGTFSPDGSFIGPADDRPDGQRTVYGGKSASYSTANNIYRPASFPGSHPITVTSQNYVEGSAAAVRERNNLLLAFPETIIHSIYCRTGDGSDVGGDFLLEHSIVANNGIYRYSEDIWDDFHTIIGFFDNITSMLEQSANIWCVEDELKENVVFLGPAGGSLVSLREDGGRQFAVWDVYNTPPWDVSGGKYYYSASFRVRVDNTNTAYISNNAALDCKIDTNEETTLEYFFELDDGGQIPSAKNKLLFHKKPGDSGYDGTDPANDGKITVPQVKTYTADINFTKVYNDGVTPLPAIEFDLVLTPAPFAEGISPYLETTESDVNGEFSFTGIPSGHTYSLYEVISRSPETLEKIAEIEVAYGEITVTQTDPEYASISGSGSCYIVVNEHMSIGDGDGADGGDVDGDGDGDGVDDGDEVDDGDGDGDGVGDGDGADGGDVDGDGDGVDDGDDNDNNDGNDGDGEETPPSGSQQTYLPPVDPTTLNTPPAETTPAETLTGGSDGTDNTILTQPPYESQLTNPPPADPTPEDSQPQPEPLPEPLPAGLLFTPGGTDPGVPPNPSVPNHELVPDGDGFIEFDEDGVPLGRWEWSDDEGMWVLDEFPPLAGLPQTGKPDVSTIMLLAAMSLLITSSVLQLSGKRRRGGRRER